jgi:hypothetical protein
VGWLWPDPAAPAEEASRCQSPLGGFSDAKRTIVFDVLKRTGRLPTADDLKFRWRQVAAISRGSELSDFIRRVDRLLCREVSADQRSQLFVGKISESHSCLLLCLSFRVEQITSKNFDSADFRRGSASNSPPLENIFGQSTRPALTPGVSSSPYRSISNSPEGVCA